MAKRTQYVRGDEVTRFWPKVDKNGPPSEHRPDLGPCWLWLAALNGAGYGIFRLATGRNARAHRWAWEHLRGPIPEGMQIDHLCRVRKCLNPAHLEVVTNKVNAERSVPGRRVWRRERTHCARGHEFTPENCFWHKGRRCCQACRDLARERRRQRKAAA